MNTVQRRRLFLSIFKKAERKYGASTKRLAGEGWAHHWQTLVVTMMSAQSRDEVTIPIAESLFSQFPTLEQLAAADIEDIEKVIHSLNYYRTKAKHIKETAYLLVKEHHGRVPDTIDELVKLPGVGRKTANLIITEVHKGDGICVDTHVHRISNVLGLVKTKTPHQTELELQKIAPRRYWGRINRLFVLWGKEVPGRDKERLLRQLG